MSRLIARTHEPSFNNAANNLSWLTVRFISTSRRSSFNAVSFVAVVLSVILSLLINSASLSRNFALSVADVYLYILKAA